MISLREKCVTLSKDSKKEKLALHVESSLVDGETGAVLKDQQIKRSAENSYYIDINCNYVCKICTTTYNSFTKFKLHEVKHHPKEDKLQNVLSVLKCPICSMEFLCSKELGRHKYRHKLTDKKKNEKIKSVICRICDKTCETDEELFIHQKTHLPSTLFPCKICGFKFKSKRQFDIHEDLCIGKTEKYKAKSKQHTTLKNKQSYSLKYKNSDKYAGKHCEHSFTTNSDKYAGKHCEHSFTTNSDLTSHMEEYSPGCKNNPKFGNFTTQKVKVMVQYECMNCKFQFKTQKQLKLHLEVCSSKSISNYGCNRQVNYRKQQQFSSWKNNLPFNEKLDLRQQFRDFIESSSEYSDDDSSQSDCGPNYLNVNKKDMKIELDDQSFTNDVSMNCDKTDENQVIEKSVCSENFDDVHMTLVNGESVNSVSDHNNSESQIWRNDLTSNRNIKKDLAINKMNASDLISNGAITVKTCENEMYICANTFEEQLKNETISNVTQVRTEQEVDDHNFEMECGICGQCFMSYKSLRSHFDQHSH